jgi:hypothetical protein
VNARKTSAALLSIASNVTLIALKVVAGVITGSVAILTEALHSRSTSSPRWSPTCRCASPTSRRIPSTRSATTSSRTSPAAFEGVLILVGATFVVYEATSRLVEGSPEVREIPIGIAIIAVTIVANLVVSSIIARRARETRSAALEGDAAHLRTDAATSVAVVVGLPRRADRPGLARPRVRAGRRLRHRGRRHPPGPALGPRAGRRDAAARGARRDPRDRRGVRAPRGRGLPQARGPARGAYHHVDMHVQFRSGTTLEDAHATVHALQDAIAARLDGADVLIHAEPEDRVLPGTEVPPQAGPSAG